MISNAQTATLADFTSPALIVPQLLAEDAASAIMELSQALQRRGCVGELAGFYRAVMERELLAPTDIETTMAIPHVRLPGLGKLSFAFGRSANGICWRANAPSEVRLVFLIAVPEFDASRYLLLISGLARIAKDERLWQQLHNAQTSFEIFEIFRRVQLQTNSKSSSAKAIRT